MSSDPLSVVVVIPCLNSGRTIEMQLIALLHQTYSSSYEVVVVDNGSDDDSVERISAVCQSYDNVRLIQAPGRLSASRARNIGVEHSSAPCILFTDADDVVDSEWIARMTLSLEDFSMVGGFLEEERLNSKKTLRGIERRSTTELVVAHSLLPHAIGTNLGIRRDVLDSVGGWLEALPGAAGDDVELSWRVQLSGHSLGKADKAIVHYRHRDSVVALIRQQYIRGRNSATVCRAYRRILKDIKTDDIPEPQRNRSNVQLIRIGLNASIRSVFDTGARIEMMSLIATAIGWSASELRYRVFRDNSIESRVQELWARFENEVGTVDKEPR